MVRCNLLKLFGSVRLKCATGPKVQHVDPPGNVRLHSQRIQGKPSVDARACLVSTPSTLSTPSHAWPGSWQPAREQLPRNLTCSHSRASGAQAGGVSLFHAAVAQTVEQLSRKQLVRGSTPRSGTEHCVFGRVVRLCVASADTPVRFRQDAPTLNRSASGEANRLSTCEDGFDSHTVRHLLACLAEWSGIGPPPRRGRFDSGSTLQLSAPRQAKPSSSIALSCSRAESSPAADSLARRTSSNGSGAYFQ